jgi:hypothetical protein
MYTIVAGRDGAQEYYNSIFALYASWGVDFIKVDDISVPYHGTEIEMVRKAIDNTGLKIVFSTSPGETPIENAEHVKTHANIWRIIGDFWDNWPQLKEHFEVCNRWSPHIGNGHFPDADMLPLGRIGIRAERGDNRMCQLSKDEQITLMSLFAVFRSPLMFGGNLPNNDAFTLSLLTNKEVLYINQYSQHNKQLFRHDDLIAWVAEDPKTGDKFLAVFNVQDPSGSMPSDSAAIPVQLLQLGINGTCTIKDVWSNKILGTFSKDFIPVIPRHGSGLYRISELIFEI